MSTTSVIIRADPSGDDYATQVSSKGLLWSAQHVMYEFSLLPGSSSNAAVNPETLASFRARYSEYQLFRDEAILRYPWLPLPPLPTPKILGQGPVFRNANRVEIKHRALLIQMVLTLATNAADLDASAYAPAAAPARGTSHSPARFVLNFMNPAIQQAAGGEGAAAAEFGANVDCKKDITQPSILDYHWIAGSEAQVSTFTLEGRLPFFLQLRQQWAFRFDLVLAIKTEAATLRDYFAALQRNSEETASALEMLLAAADDNSSDHSKSIAAFQQSFMEQAKTRDVASLEEVDLLLMRIDGVLDLCARRRDDTYGEQLVARVAAAQKSGAPEELRFISRSTDRGIEEMCVASYQASRQRINVDLGTVVKHLALR